MYIVCHNLALVRDRINTNNGLPTSEEKNTESKKFIQFSKLKFIQFRIK